MNNLTKKELEVLFEFIGRMNSGILTEWTNRLNLNLNIDTLDKAFYRIYIEVKNNLNKI